MRTATLKVRKYKHAPATPFMIDTRENGKRKRLFFKTKTAAEQELTRIKTKLNREGSDALSLSDELRTAALAIQKDLEPFGKTLRDAGTHYLRFLRESQRSITVSALAAEYLAMKESKGLSAVHMRDLRNRYAVFCADFGDCPVRTLSAKTIESWLNGLALSKQSVKNFRSRIGAVLAYGVKHDYLEANPVLAIDAPKVVGKPPEILTVDQLIRLLNTATVEMLPLIAIGAFAGVRTGELTKLDWRDVDIARGFVKIEAGNAKTARRRVIKMEPCLQQWLAPFAGRIGPIFTNTAKEASCRFNQKMAPIAKAAGIDQWPDNGLRHSFASYHYAKYQDAGKLAADLGHTTTKLIFSNYRELVHPEEGTRYFNILPPAPALNVVPMASA
jgi:integrase